MNKFSEFASNENNLSGSKLHFSDLLNKEILVRGFRNVTPKYNTKECVQIQFSFIKEDGTAEEKEHIVFTGSVVLIKQLRAYADKIPFTATVKREGSSTKSYLTFA